MYGVSILARRINTWERHYRYMMEIEEEFDQYFTNVGTM